MKVTQSFLLSRGRVEPLLAERRTERFVDLGFDSDNHQAVSVRRHRESVWDVVDPPGMETSHSGTAMRRSSPRNSSGPDSNAAPTPGGRLSAVSHDEAAAIAEAPAFQCKSGFASNRFQSPADWVGIMIRFISICVSQHGAAYLPAATTSESLVPHNVVSVLSEKLLINQKVSTHIVDSSRAGEVVVKAP